MTAEIIVMNKLAVALAADSAVTIGYQSGNKIYNSANKLFMLSGRHSIGIMIYGSAELMQVPWEVIIKLYRIEIGRNRYTTLKKYVYDFLDFLQKSQKQLFPPENQEEYLKTIINRYYILIIQEFENILNELAESKGQISEEDFSSMLKSTIDKHFNELKETPSLDYVDQKFAKQIETKVNDIFQPIYDTAFKEIPVETAYQNKLKRIAVFLVTKDIFPDSVSGVVFAGFGEDEIFPSAFSLEIEAVIENRLKYAHRDQSAISYEAPAAIAPFAQSDMVAMFMEGINPTYRQFIRSYLSRLFEQYPSSLVEYLSGLKDEDKAKLLEKLESLGDNMLADFTQLMETFQNRIYVQPVMQNVAFLPIDELAAMAEALVNLTSFKRRVSPESETVGGPIDVAVITKKDGFIWIRRKHYFKPEFNHHFFVNYEREYPEAKDVTDESQ